MYTKKQILEYKKELLYLVDTNIKGIQGLLKHSKKYLLEFVNAYVDLKLINSKYKYTIANKIFWILNDIHEFPKCKHPNCNVILEHPRYFRSFVYGYQAYCCNKCSKDNDITRNKTLQTNLQRRSVKYPALDSNVVKLYHKTCKRLYGVSSYTLSNDFKDKLAKVTKKRIEKQVLTKKINGTINTSKLEEQVYISLIDVFGKNNIKRQYKDNTRYPFYCDFYIETFDMFIECNFHWTHGNHKFNKNDKNDIDVLKTWKKKHTKFYDNAVLIWSVKDILKYEHANTHNLKYYCFYTVDEYIKWILQYNIKYENDITST